jgi:4-amino-4-deoxy-L-arabinose transferase-like glycosyltransferase
MSRLLPADRPDGPPSAPATPAISPGAPTGTAPPAPEPDLAPTGVGPGWARPARWALLAATALAYLWNLSASGYANSFYAAAAQAGAQSWKALLFGSVDAGNTITVDKPPAAMWVMALSARLFGFSSWSVLAPQALMGVAAVALLVAAVGRWAGPVAGLAAGTVLALTPVSVLMFRFDNPDALLVLLMVAAAYAVVRAVDGDRGGTGWLALAGALVGLGFLAKMLEVLLIVPALAGVYLVAARPAVRARLARLAVAGVAMVASAGWYVALVQLWPASDRPYIGGSTTNSLWELAVGYNGLSRILGRHGSPVPGAPPDAAFSALGHHGPGGFGLAGATGPGRLFGAAFAGNASWLLPAALLVLVAALWLTRRRPRADRTRAGLLLWGGWLVVSGLVLSFMKGTVHPYYVLAMAPALAATLVVGAGELWRNRAHPGVRVTLGVALLGTAVWSWVLLGRTPQFLPWLRWVVLVVGAVGALVPVARRRRGALARVLVLAAALVGLLGGSTAYAAQTELTPQHGGGVSAGPRVMSARFGGDPRMGIGRRGAPGAAVVHGTGGFGGSATVDPAVADLLRSAGTTWSAATLGSQSAASLELATGTSVIGVGGFTGSDETPTPAQFQHWVTTGQVRYFVVAVSGPGGGRSARRGGVGQQISAWVVSHYRGRTIGGSTVYDLARPADR